MRLGTGDLSAAKDFDPVAFLAHVGQGRTIVSLKKRQTIFSQGDPADAVFYIRRGRVKLTILSRQGKEAVIGIFGPSDFFGEGCLTGQPLRTATAISITECSITRVQKAAMTAVLHDQPSFSEIFISYLLSRNLRIEEDLTDQLFNSSELRLARALLLLTRFGKEGETDPVIPKISQQTLAEMIGTTRSRVSFFMSKFKKLGLISYNNGLEVHSSLLNVVLHEPTHKTSDAEPPDRKPVSRGVLG